MLRQDRHYIHTEGVFVQRSALRKQATLHFEGFKDSLRPLATQKNFLIRNLYVNIFQMRPWSSLSVTSHFWLYLWAEIWIPNSEGLWTIRIPVSRDLQEVGRGPWWCLQSWGRDNSPHGAGKLRAWVERHSQEEVSSFILFLGCNPCYEI